MGGLELSDVQRQVVGHDRGHLRIIACPGSGKTEVVSRRVAELIRKGADPSRIVAFTFTRKAAEELKLRIRARVADACPEKSDFGDMFIGTIDSFCLYMIKEIRPEYRSFEVLDTARRMAFVDRWYYDLGLDGLGSDAGKWRTMTKFCRSIDIVMMERLDRSSMTDAAFAECYDRYVEKLGQERFFDFSSVIHTLLDMLRDDPGARERLGGLVSHVVFDEYQDVNTLQEELLERLSEASESVCVVGDDDQNIFSWRGSNSGYILDFSKKYSKYGSVTRRLDTNYRATDGLIEVAGRLIRNNPTREEKDMRPHAGQNRAFESGDIVHHHFETDVDEFGFIAESIGSLRGTDFVDKHGAEHGLSYRDMAVIVKTNEDAARIIRYFDESGIPCITDSGGSVFDVPVVALAADCIFYAFAAPGLHGDSVPDPDDLQDRYSEHVNRSRSAEFMEELGRVRKRAGAVAGRGGGWLPNLGLQEFYHRVLSAMGAEDGLLDDADMYNLAVLSTVISDYEYVYQSLRAGQVVGLKWFIIQFAESNYSDPRHNDPSAIDAVRVMTIWKAKGLEFPAVFVPTFVSRKPPRGQDTFLDDGAYDSERYAGGEEDERRAYYTAVTRSQKYLFLTGARKRTIAVNGSVSKRPIRPHGFLKEIECGRMTHSDIPPARRRSGREARQHASGILPTSYSKLSVYDRCPHDYRLRHVMGFNAGVPAAYGYGTNIHNIMNAIHSEYIRNGNVPTGGDIEGKFEDMFYMRFAPGRQNENMKRAGIRVVRNYVDVHRGDFSRILDTEKRFELAAGEALISGSIDLLKKVDKDGKTTEIEIIDFKTDTQRKDGRYELDYSEQVRFYAYATRQSLGYTPQRAVVHHLDTDKKEYVDIGEDVLDKTKSGVDDKVRKIVSEEFEPAPEESKCRGCDFRSLCPHKGFSVGADFRPVASNRRSGPPADMSEPETPHEHPGGEAGDLGPSVVSDNMRRKAEELAQAITSGGIRRGGDGSYIITSGSDPGKTYRVTGASCQCMGFRRYPMRHPGTRSACYHTEAVRLAESP